jgi:excisionase family DNA binding protein
MTTIQAPLLLTIAEAADFVGVGRDEANRLVNLGEWPHEKVGPAGVRRLVPRAFLIMRYGLQPKEESQ